MKIQKGIVKYKDRNDIVCCYGVTDDGKQYYFLDETGEKKFHNGNRVASTALVEAIDPMVKASNIGMIDENGNEVIPFVNRMIKPVNDDILLVELANPISESVIEANRLKSDPLSATKLVSTPALIKDKLNAKMGPTGRYLFNDQFSEATVCDINGNNLVNDEYFSFIGISDGKLYFSKNNPESEITEYSIFPPKVQSDITVENDTNEIDVKEAELPTEVVEEAMNHKSLEESMNQPNPPIVEGPSVPDVPTNNVVTPSESLIEKEPKEEVVPDVPPLNEVMAEEVSPEQNEESEVVEEAIPEETEEVPAAEESTPDSEEVPVEKEVAPVTEEEKEIAPVDIAPPVVEPDEEEQVTEEPETPIEESVAEEPADDLKILFDEKEEEKIEEPVEEQQELDDSDIFGSTSISQDPLPQESFDDVYSNLSDTSFDSNGDTIMTDVAKSMTSLIKQNKEQKEKISDYQHRLEELDSFKRSVSEKVRAQKEKMESLSAKIRKYESTISLLEAKTESLEDKVGDQQRLIDSQTRELNSLRPQLKGKEDLVKLLADAQILLDDEPFEYSDHDF